MKSDSLIQTERCYHCGQSCENKPYKSGIHSFCCTGCRTVFEILSQNSLCEYYELNEYAGNSQKKSSTDARFAYLELEEVKTKLLDFTDGKTSKVSFYIPNIHCSSCIWLLENLHKIHQGITYSRTDFLQKKVAITYQESETSLSEIATLLNTLGYCPYITLNDTQKSNQDGFQNENKALLIKIAVAGFCFGNVMLLSFPEYFGFDSSSINTFRYVFGTLNIILSIPAFFYSGWGYSVSAYQSLQKKIINIDFPLALGMWVLWLRSLFEIFTETGAGYIDTLTGLVFFLLLGKWFQQRTYHSLNYERDFKSYFPVAVIVKEAGKEKPVAIDSLKIGDRIVIRNQELIPADSILLYGDAHIDYSFVTGEGATIPKQLGEIVYAGGKQAGDVIELEIIKTVSQSYLTALWNNQVFHKPKDRLNTFQSLISRYFTVFLLLIAFTSGFYWIVAAGDYVKAINAFSAVLIIACPCALALSSPFALGTALRVLSGFNFYSKNTQTIEGITKINQIVFDKTGTITENNQSDIHFVPFNGHEDLNDIEKNYVKILTKNSIHPLSTAIYTYLSDDTANNVSLNNFKEIAGKGLVGAVDGHLIKMGSKDFINMGGLNIAESDNETLVHIVIDNLYRGHFNFRNKYREGIGKVMRQLSNQGMELNLLSGDNAGEKENLLNYFEDASQLHFRQSPEDKLNFIAQKQMAGNKIMMLGDGLNDAGALQQSTVGIAVSENTAYFTPASDVIMQADTLRLFPSIILFCKNTMRIIYMSFAISLVYNIIGLSFAVQGTLSPVIAAILMPLSSITVILFATLSVYYSKYIIRA